MSVEISVDEYLAKRKDFVRANGVVLKGFRAPPSWNPEKRTARFVMSTEEPDRDRDIIVQAGLDTTTFMTNPVAPFGHRSHDLPIGKWSDIQRVNGKPKRTEGTLEFCPEGVDEMADRVARHVGAGTVRAVSIGFFPKKLRQRERDHDDMWPGYEITESELVECSVVSIPANAGALVKSSGSDDPRIAREFVEEVLDTWAKDPVTGLLVPRKEFDEAYRMVKTAALDDLVVKRAGSASAEATESEIGADPSTEAPAEAPEVKASPLDRITVQIEADTTQVEAAVAKTESLLDRLAGKMAKIFGRAEPAPVDPPAPPSPEAIAAAKSAAAETLARLKDAGRI